jgi:hypothetical protein
MRGARVLWRNISGQRMDQFIRYPITFYIVVDLRLKVAAHVGIQLCNHKINERCELQPRYRPRAASSSLKALSILYFWRKSAISVIQAACWPCRMYMSRALDSSSAACL